MAKLHIKTVQKDYYPFDSWITKLEMRAFGWTYKGYDTEYYDTYDLHINWDDETATLTQRFRTYTKFKRIEPYSYNIIFKYFELLMSIQSWIRRKLIFLFWGICALGVIISAFMFFTTKDLRTLYILPCVLFVVGYIYLPSLFYALFGYLTRKIFRLDKKLKNRLEKNGYNREQNL